MILFHNSRECLQNENRIRWCLWKAVIVWCHRAELYSPRLFWPRHQEIHGTSVNTLDKFPGSLISDGQTKEMRDVCSSKRNQKSKSPRWWWTEGLYFVKILNTWINMEDFGNGFEKSTQDEDWKEGRHLLKWQELTTFMWISLPTSNPNWEWSAWETYILYSFHYRSTL